jgi:hypothetical protein
MFNQDVSNLIKGFLRKVVVMDAILAILVVLVGLALGLRMLESYGTLMIWTGGGLIFLATVTGVGGYASRAADSEAFRLTRAGNPTENLQHIAESSQNSFGCVFLLVSIGMGLAALGSLLSAAATLLEQAIYVM